MLSISVVLSQELCYILMPDELKEIELYKSIQLLTFCGSNFKECGSVENQGVRAKVIMAGPSYINRHFLFELRSFIWAE